MKIAKLLFLGAMLLIGGNAMAEIVDGVRQKPMPAQSALVEGDTMYLYNRDAKLFHCGGNDYLTRGSVGEEGYMVIFTKHLDATGGWDGKAYRFQNYIDHDSWHDVKAWMNVWFATDDGSVWIDNNTASDSIWNITPVDGEAFRLSVGSDNPVFNAAAWPDKFYGMNANIDNGANTRCWFNLIDSVGHHIDWYFVSPEGYEAYKPLVELYNAALPLKAILDEAKSKGVDVAAQQAVYENEAATIEEIEAAINAVKAAIAALDEAGVTADNPVDKTSFIVNPLLDTNAEGWSGTAPAFGSGVAEHFNKTFDTYQNIEGVPNGVYALTVQAFYRCAAWGTAEAYDHLLAGTAENVSMYAKSGEDSIRIPVANIFKDATPEALGTAGEAEIGVTGGLKFWVPRDMASAAAYFTAGRYVNKMFFSVEGNKTRIGLAKTTGIGDDWTLFGNWTLTYYGGKEDAYKVWMQEVIAQAPNYDNLPEGTYVTNGFVDTYKAAVEAVSGAATKADILAAQVAIDEAAAVVDANIAAWRKLAAAKVRAEETAANPDLSESDDKMALADYVEFELADIFSALSLSNEEIEAEIKKIEDMIDQVNRNSLKVGADVTNMFLTNPDYSQGTTGWSGSWTAVASGCMEAYERDWDAYQIVKDAPVGVYEVSLQGFYRVARGTTAWTMWANGEQKCPGHVYVNNNETEVPCVFTEPVSSVENIYSGSTSGAEGNYCQFETATPNDSVCFPNDMGSAGEAFAKGMYKASAFGLVAKQGDELRLGVKGKKQSATWVIWDNFKMVYQGYKADIIKPELQKAVDNATANQTKTMGKSVKELIGSAVAAGNAALAQEDGKVMFEALAALFEVNDTVASSVALFEQLTTAAGEMFQASQISPASQDVITEATTLYAEIMGGVDDGTYEDSDVEALLAKIAEMTTKLKIPAGEASDASPLDMTSVIVNPSFEKDGANSIEGWSGTSGYNFGNDDTQKGALLLEFYEKTFNMYQDLVGLPNGTYEVGVYAFDRFGNTADDYKAFVADPIFNEGWLYALPDADSTQMATAYLAHHSAYAGEDKGYTGTTSYENNDGVTVFVPNDMVSAKNYFANEGLYYNKVIVKVTNGKLRIGINKPTKVTGSWVIMDNWQLKYFGENSAMTPSGDAVTSIESIDNAAVKTVKVEFFGINGAKTSSLQKGINIVKSTMSDGSVVTKKLIVR